MNFTICKPHLKTEIALIMSPCKGTISPARWWTLPDVAIVTMVTCSLWDNRQNRRGYAAISAPRRAKRADASGPLSSLIGLSLGHFCRQILVFYRGNTARQISLSEMPDAV
jgi:hypothetical protein